MENTSASGNNGKWGRAWHWGERASGCADRGGRDTTGVGISMEQKQINKQRTVAERVVLRWENYEEVRYLHGHWSWNGTKLSATGQFCDKPYV